MAGKLKLLAAVLFPLSLLSAQPDNRRMPQITAEYQKNRQQAVAINELAGNLKSPEDARKLVNMVADVFADQLPPKWVTGKVRKRLAMAEYQSATNPEKLIPEQQIADAWNRYVTELGAPPDTLVTAAEVHYLRDAFYTSNQLSWTHGIQNLWSMPGIYAVGADGKVAHDCRTLEALRIVWDFANQYENLQGAREAVKKGFLFSDHFRPPREGEKVQGRVSIRTVVRNNPVEDAEIRYTRERGELAMAQAIGKLVEDILPD
jgi:hypothetical protein